MKGSASVRKKLLLIINPTSGRGIIKDYLLLIISQLSLAGYEVVVYPTKAKYDAVEKMKEARNYDLVVASGGDGTLNEVITGLMRIHQLRTFQLERPMILLPHLEFLKISLKR